MITRDLENFCVVSVLAFPLPTPGRGAVAVTKDHKNISCLMGPYNTETGNDYIYNHATNYLESGGERAELERNRRALAISLKDEREPLN